MFAVLAGLIVAVDLWVNSFDSSFDSGPGEYMVFVGAVVAAIGCLATSPGAAESSGTSGSWWTSDRPLALSPFVGLLGVAQVVPPPNTVGLFLGLVAMMPQTRNRSEHP